MSDGVRSAEKRRVEYGTSWEKCVILWDSQISEGKNIQECELNLIFK